MNDSSQPTGGTLVRLASNIVSAYVSANAIPASNVPELIRVVHAALGQATPAIEDPKREPAVPINRSVKRDYIVCLEDGKGFRSLKRHLRIYHDLSPEEYRERWDLPSDYPMAAPSYAQARSEAAKKMGFGRRIKRQS